MTGRGGACFAANPEGTELWVIAGFSGQENNDIHRFDIASKTWHTDSKWSEGFRPRSVAGHCTFDDKILIFGGEVDPSGLGHDGAGSFACDTVLWDCKTYTFS